MISLIGQRQNSSTIADEEEYFGGFISSKSWYGKMYSIIEVEKLALSSIGKVRLAPCSGPLKTMNVFMNRCVWHIYDWCVLQAYPAN